jgi:hypothetical protein
MDRREALAKVEQMDVAERIGKLSEPAMAYVKNRVEQAVLEEQRTTGSKQPENDSEGNGEHKE